MSLEQETDQNSPRSDGQEILHSLSEGKADRGRQTENGALP